MSVYRPRNGKGEFTTPFYHYDFWIGRHRFHGSTKGRTRREAEAFERRRRVQAKGELDALADAPPEGPMTIDVACGRFWDEVGQYYRGQYRQTFETALSWICDTIGADKPIRDIDNPEVARIIARRRGEASKAGANRKKPAEKAPKLVSNSTVNRTVTEPLRAVLFRARDAWEQTIANIKWGKHILPEPKERVRELSASEEKELLPALPDDYAKVVAFTIVSGCRLKECVGLLWSDIDWAEREITIRGKGDIVAKIPLTGDMRDLLFPMRGLHPTAVFTYACRKKRGARAVGDRLPITYSGLKTEWQRGRARTGIVNFRFHDNRHTAATRLLRAGGNLKLVQHLLRHSDIATTAKYAHATPDDLREAMEKTARRQARSATPSPEKIPEISGNVEIQEAAIAAK